MSRIGACLLAAGCVLLLCAPLGAAQRCGGTRTTMMEVSSTVHEQYNPGLHDLPDYSIPEVPVPTMHADMSDKQDLSRSDMAGLKKVCIPDALWKAADARGHTNELLNYVAQAQLQMSNVAEAAKAAAAAHHDGISNQQIEANEFKIEGSTKANWKDNQVELDFTGVAKHFGADPKIVATQVHDGTGWEVRCGHSTGKVCHPSQETIQNCYSLHVAAKHGHLSKVSEEYVPLHFKASFDRFDYLTGSKHMSPKAAAAFAKSLGNFAQWVTETKHGGLGEDAIEHNLEDAHKLETYVNKNGKKIGAKKAAAMRGEIKEDEKKIGAAHRKKLNAAKRHAEKLRHNKGAAHHNKQGHDGEKKHGKHARKRKQSQQSHHAKSAHDKSRAHREATHSKAHARKAGKKARAGAEKKRAVGKPARKDEHMRTTRNTADTKER